MKIGVGLIQALCCVGMIVFMYAASIPEVASGDVVSVAAKEVQGVSEIATVSVYEIVEAEIIRETAIPEIDESIEIVEMESVEVIEPTPAPTQEPEGAGTDEYVDFAIADVRNYVNVRNKPTTEGDIVGKIYGGAVAQIVETAGEQNDWFKIISGNVEGYIKSDYFIHGEEAAAVMDSCVVSYAEILVKKLNVRAGQSTGDRKIGYLELGEKVPILENCGEWLKIQYTADAEGYIATEYVTTVEAYSYAKSLEEEAAEKATDKIRQERKPAEQKVVEETSEEILEVIPPAVTYASNEELRKEIINYALQFVGNKYVNGGSSLTSGTDCSGFTCFIFAEFGYSISRTPSGQYSNAGRSIDISQIQPGDIVCYSSNGGKSCTHVAFYIGDGKIVHSANSRKGVITSDIDFEPIIGVRNVID